MVGWTGSTFWGWWTRRYPSLPKKDSLSLKVSALFSLAPVPLIKLTWSSRRYAGILSVSVARFVLLVAQNRSRLSIGEPHASLRSVKGLEPDFTHFSRFQAIFEPQTKLSSPPKPTLSLKSFESNIPPPSPFPFLVPFPPCPLTSSPRDPPRMLHRALSQTTTHLSLQKHPTLALRRRCLSTFRKEIYKPPGSQSWMI